jgi:tetratricopeptide (TPR) repeat protein
LFFFYVSRIARKSERIKYRPAKTADECTVLERSMARMGELPSHYCRLGELGEFVSATRINLRSLKISNHNINKRYHSMAGHTSKCIMKAMSLTNDGACLIEAGDFNRALQCLAEALIISRQSPDLVDDCSETEGRPHFSVSCNLDHQNMALGSNNDDIDDKSFVFHQPMRIIFLPSVAPRCNETNHTITATIIFNLALTHHRLASSNKGGSNSTKLLKKAIELYGYAFELYRAGVVVPTNGIVLLATMNNLAQAYTTLGEMEHAETCFRQLLSTLMFLVDSQYMDVPGNLDRFFRSTFHLMVSATSLSAPAA